MPIHVAARYPLTWPDGVPRTRSRLTGVFKVDFARARDDLLHSVTLLGGRAIVLSTNVALRRDGLPYSNLAEPADPGVAIYFDRVVSAPTAERPCAQVLRPFVLACDTYRKVKSNLRALGATVNALRDIQRHACSSMLEQAFVGFAALPAKSVVARAWRQVLGVRSDATDREVRDAYRNLAAKHHPDKLGGDAARMTEINTAFAQSREELTG